jgi:hypothetical protein
MDPAILDGFTPLPYKMHGWGGESPVFKTIIDEVKPTTIIEVGTWMGMSACHMADLAPEAQVYCVDTWLGSTEFWTTMEGTPDRDLMLTYSYPNCYYQFISNVIHRKLVDRITPIPVPSEIGAEVLKHRGVLADLIYIDAGHSYEEVMRDVRCYLPLLRPGGVMFGDDVLYWPGVGEAAMKLGAGVMEDKWVLRS